MQKFKLILKKLMSLFPTALPVGMAEFNTWSESIIELSGKYADEDSMKYAIATMIMNLGPQRSHVSKNFFVRSLRKAAANQVAGQVFYDIKTKQDQARKAAEETAAKAKEAANGGEKEA